MALGISEIKSHRLHDALQHQGRASRSPARAWRRRRCASCRTTSTTTRPDPRTRSPRCSGCRLRHHRHLRRHLHRRPSLRHHLQRHAGAAQHRRHHDHRGAVRLDPAAEQARTVPWPTGETQRVTIAHSTATGTFTLSLNYLTLGTFTTADIAFGASAADVQAALLAASNGSQTLASQGTLTVTKNGDDYDIAFAGGFNGRNLKNLQVALDVDGGDPSGSFAIQYLAQHQHADRLQRERGHPGGQHPGGAGRPGRHRRRQRAGELRCGRFGRDARELQRRLPGHAGQSGHRQLHDAFGGLGNATAAPFEVRAGRAVVSEEQTVVITTAASEAGFKS
jgi:hypothetical protein